MATPHAGLATSRIHAWAGRRPDLFRHLLNRWPCFRGTGARVTRIETGWQAVHVTLPISRRTRNYVGTIFGGSLYAAVDPHFMFMLMHQLGPGYLVWDKAASIRFRRPGRSHLHAVCRLPEGEEDEVRRILATQERTDRTYHVDLVDAEGVVHATVEKVVNVKRV